MQIQIPFSSLEWGSSSNHAACPNHRPTCNAVQLFVGQWQLAKFQFTNVKALNGQQVLACPTSVITHPWIMIDISSGYAVWLKLNLTNALMDSKMIQDEMLLLTYGCHGTWIKIKMTMGEFRVAHGSPVHWASPSARNQRSSHLSSLHWCSLQRKWPSFQRNLT